MGNCLYREPAEGHAPAAGDADGIGPPVPAIGPTGTSAVIRAPLLNTNVTVSASPARRSRGRQRISRYRDAPALRAMWPPPGTGTANRILGSPSPLSTAAPPGDALAPVSEMVPAVLFQSWKDSVALV